MLQPIHRGQHACEAAVPPFAQVAKHLLRQLDAQGGGVLANHLVPVLLPQRFELQAQAPGQPGCQVRQPERQHGKALAAGYHERTPGFSQAIDEMEQGCLPGGISCDNLQVVQANQVQLFQPIQRRVPLRRQ